MPDFVEGVINLRGNVIPIVDLRKKFGLEGKERDNQTRIVVVNIQEKIVGFIVDEVDQVLRLSEDQIEAAPEMGSSINKEYLKGVGKLDDRLLILLNLDSLLTLDDHGELEKSVNNKLKKEEG
jgi:purine-binding chemotaxis protein CheW